MSRFLRGGRAIQASKNLLREGLERHGYDAEAPLARKSVNPETIQENEIVKQALRYLLHAVEAYEQHGGHRGH